MLNSPSALIHSHIQLPALSIHQSPHFVSADFIPALTAVLQPSRGRGGAPPPAATCLLPDLLTEDPVSRLSFSIARARKTLILNLIPIVLLFTFSIEEDGRKTQEKQGGGGIGVAGVGGEWREMFAEFSRTICTPVRWRLNPASCTTHQ